MITLLVLITVLILVVAFGLVAAGLIAISPFLLLLLCLPFLDWFVIKSLFKKKKKDE